MVTGLERNSVRLVFEERGQGQPPLLMIHAWAANRTFFQPQLEHFGRSHRVVAVDLRGHGESDKPVLDYAVATFADDLAWLCGELALSRSVLVGHSMGGIIALELAASRPDLACAIVAVDSPLLPSPDLAGPAQSLLRGMQSPMFREVTREFQGQFVGFAADPTQRAGVLDTLASGEQHVMAPTLESVFAYDAAPSLTACMIPLLYVASVAPSAGFTDLGRVRELCPHLVVEEIGGAGHFVTLEAPEQLNAAIDRFLDSLRAI